LREVLGQQAMQKGSLVGPDRLRFDFTHDTPLSEEELWRIEEMANRWIEENLEGSVRVMSYRDAIGTGATAIFEEKYGDQVRVLSFGDVSTELCGGTHARATGDIGLLKILSESGIAAGIRRIEALTGMGALRHIREGEQALKRTASLLKTSVEEVPARVDKLLEERRESQREIERLQSSTHGESGTDWLADARPLEGGGKALAVRVEGVDAKGIRTMVDDLRNRLGSGVVMLVSENDGKVLLAVGVTKDRTDAFRAGELVSQTAALLGGKGGGRADFAQAGGRDASQIEAAIVRFHEVLGTS
jgi:alanyl-tRNA synthetase